MRCPSPARSLEWAVVTCALFLLTNALDAPLHAQAAAGASPLLARAILIPVFAGAALALARSPREAAAAAVAWPVLLLVALAAASACWSTDPSVTLRWITGLLGTTVVGLFLAIRFDIDEQLAIVCAALGAVVLASAAVAILWPAAGRSGSSWVGVFEERNLLGRAMGLSLAAGFVLAIQRKDLRVYAGAGCALAAIVLLGSRSVTAAVVAPTCLLATAAVVWLRGRSGRTRRRAAVLGAVAGLLGAVLVLQHVDGLVALVGRDTTLTGRTELWTKTLHVAVERPWFGHGYATFWPRAQAEPDRLTYRRTGQPARHPHNGLLEIFFELGAVGVLVFLVPFLVLARRALSRSLVPGASVWPLAYLLFLALSNVTESDLLRHKIFWALYVAMAVDLFGGAPAKTAPPLNG